MGSTRHFYMFILAFVLVVALTIYLIVDSSWYNTVHPAFLLFMYIGIAVVSFGMRDEMLDRFEKWYIYERPTGKCWSFFLGEISKGTFFNNDNTRAVVYKKKRYLAHLLEYVI